MVDDAEWVLGNWLIPIADALLFNGVEDCSIHKSIPLPSPHRLRSPERISESAKHRTPSESEEATENSLPSCNPA